MGTKKRLLAMILTFCMVLSFAPITAFADEGVATGPSGMPDSNIGTGGTSNGRVEVDTTYVSGVNAAYCDKNPNMGTISFSMNESCFVWNSQTDGLDENRKVSGRRVLGYPGAVKEVTFNDNGVVVIDVNYAENSKKPVLPDEKVEFGLYKDDKLEDEIRFSEIGARSDSGGHFNENNGRAVISVEKNQKYYLGARVPLLEDTNDHGPDYDTDIDKVSIGKEYMTAKATSLKKNITLNTSQAGSPYPQEPIM